MSTRHADNNPRRSPFGDLLVSFRNQRGLTQEKLARATQGESMSSRSITNYERAVVHPKDWVTPHRTGLRLLVDALQLDMVDHHALVTAWDKTRSMRSAAVKQGDGETFIRAGREEAIRDILDSWEKAQSGIPQVVLIDGVTGIGKTALARHISDTIAGSVKNVMITHGHAVNWASDVEPYYAIRQATDRLLGPPETSAMHSYYPSRPTMGDKEIQRVVESIPLLSGALISERAIRQLSTEINDSLSSQIRAQLAGKSATNASERMEEYCQLLIDLSRSWPVVLMLGSLHWAGDQTLALLTHISHRLQDMRNTPILILGTFRSDEAPQFDDEQGRLFNELLNTLNHAPHAKLVNLNDSLAPDAGMAYIREATGFTPMIDTENAGQLATWLHTRTSGHPLLVSELLQHLKETGALSNQSDNLWKFDPARLSGDTPAAIATFMKQRLDRVSKKARRILDIAATMNDVIITEIIAEIMGTDEGEILEIIDQELDATHQLLLPGAPLLLHQQSHTSYHFHRAIFREHVYNAIPSPRRRKLHLAIARAMEERYTDADTDALAEITNHFVQAEDWHSAQMAGYRQAQNATLRLDWDLAEIWYEQAEALALKAQDPVQLWRTRAAHLAVHRGTGNFEEAIESGKRIIEISERHNWPTTVALAYHHLGEIYYDLGQIGDTIDHLQTAVDLHLQEGSLDLAAAGYSMLSHAMHRQGRLDTARDFAQKALNLSREIDNSWVLPEAVLALANCETDLGYYEDAIANYNMATELSLMAGRLHNQFIPPMNIGLCHIFMQNHEKAIEVLEDLIQKIKAQSIYRHIAPPSLYLGYAKEALGQLDEAGDAYETSAKIRRTTIPQPTLYDALAGQMRVAIGQKRDHAARTWLKEITTQLNQHGTEGMEYPQLVLTSVANAFRYFGDEKPYREYVIRAHALVMERAEIIENVESRESFLNNIPMNLEAQVMFNRLKRKEARLTE